MGNDGRWAMGDGEGVSSAEKRVREKSFCLVP